VQVKEEFFGCFSFVDVAPGLPAGAPITLKGAIPALNDEEFAARQAQLRQALRDVQCTPLDL
jgi:hypothetical protein